jgi:FAD/FMN-containing dehydrogenase
MPFGLRTVGRADSSLPDDVIDFLVDHYLSGDERAENTILFEPLHGAASRVDPAATAFAYRNARFNVSPLAVWQDPAMDDEEVTWAKTARDRLQQLSAAGYLNYASDASAEAVEGAFGAEAWARLRAIKTAWDQDNLFRFNHNIPPA